MIKMIAAVSKNMVIGKNNTIPWDYPEDLKHFKKMTLNSVIIMGRNTFESIGSKPLPKRKNIVITRGYPINDNVISFATIEGALSEAKSSNFEDIWLIGGRSIYENGMKYADEIHLTRIPETIDGDDVVKFPEIDKRFSLKSTEEIAESLFKDIYTSY